MSVEVLFLIACAALAGFWYDSMRAREAALDSARRATEAADCQLLDATVSLEALRPAREAGDMLRLRRVYRFEFSDDGQRRLEGRVTLHGNRPQRVELEPHRERPPTWTVIRGGRDLDPDPYPDPRDDRRPERRD
jgi:hypothetical protein